MERKDIEEYNYQQKKRELDFLVKLDSNLDQRIAGIKAIKDIICPWSSMTTFYRRHRPYLDYILFEDQDHWRTGRPKFFTFRRLIYHYMLGRRKI